MDIFEKIKNGNVISDCEFMQSNASPFDIFRAYEKKIRGLEKINSDAAIQYDKVVEQNHDLQTELKNTKEAPFFPYPLNDGNRADFGEFYLISHAWFTFLNTADYVGVIEVEFKDVSKSRKMYIGIGKGKDISVDVMNIAHYGQKIKG
jgi:hypothetical protein